MTRSVVGACSGGRDAVTSQPPLVAAGTVPATPGRPASVTFTPAKVSTASERGAGPAIWGILGVGVGGPKPLKRTGRYGIVYIYTCENIDNHQKDTEKCVMTGYCCSILLGDLSDHFHYLSLLFMSHTLKLILRTVAFSLFPCA